MRLDCRRFISAIGGRRDVWTMCVRNGMKISQRAVDKWIERNSIPSEALIKIMLALKQKGVSIDLTNFSTTHEHEQKESN